MSYDQAALVALFTAIAAFVDIRYKRIPNFVTVPAAVLGLLYHCFAPNGMGPLMAVAGFAVGFALLLLPWLLGGGGMGDVKLLAALGTWLGPMLILGTFAASAMMAGLIALAVITGSAFTHGVITTKQKYLVAGNHGVTSEASGGHRRPQRRTLPFAVPVALATWVVLGWLLMKQSMGL